MKKYVSLVLISIVILAVSCQKKQDVTDFYDLGSEFYTSSPGMTSLDDHTVINIKNPLINLSSIALKYSGIVDLDGHSTVPTTTDLGNITLSSTDGKGTVTLTDAQLNLTTIGWKSNFALSAVFDGKPFSRNYSITLADPISVNAPGITHQDKLFYFAYDVEPTYATVDNVTIQTKLFYNGTYADVAGTHAATDSISFNGSAYNIGDTIYVKVTATAGTKTATTETQLAVGSHSTLKTHTFTLDQTAGMAYDFIDAKFVKTTTAVDSADIELTMTPFLGGYSLGFISNQNASFVLATSDDYSNADDLAIANTDFSAAITSVNNLAGGEIYIFRTKRGTGAYSYGIMKVISISKPEGVITDSSIKIEFKK
jgi:hypothetical protein